jgi:hypothetical protein
MDFGSAFGPAMIRPRWMEITPLLTAEEFPTDRMGRNSSRLNGWHLRSEIETGRVLFIHRVLLRNLSIGFSAKCESVPRLRTLARFSTLWRFILLIAQIQKLPRRREVREVNAGEFGFDSQIVPPFRLGPEVFRFHSSSRPSLLRGSSCSDPGATRRSLIHRKYGLAPCKPKFSV